MNQGHDNNLSGKGNKDEEVALMVQSEQIKKSDDEHQEEESEVEVFIETDQAKIQNGHPVKIKSYHPRNQTKQGYGFKNPKFVKWQNDERKKQIVGDRQRQIKNFSPSKKSSRSFISESKLKMNYQDNKFLKPVNFVSIGIFDLNNF
ncbi:hypothetical protein QVD17_08540 [Tagetes erecta]|uniref:Uncharacterized protein n=1 Tax=Tagetes erecta TaxID=13708 RepID=A0AAD8KZK7_TARER|nr:hypothetical protein QVD17_08540 [Tagetes erecta]